MNIFKEENAMDTQNVKLQDLTPLPLSSLTIAGNLWSEYQRKDDTQVHFFPGIKQVFRRLRSLPQGIVSQNSKDNISYALKENNLSSCVHTIIGYAEVDIRRQKPEPDGLLMCIQKMIGSQAGILFYIGDHEMDVQCCQKANHRLYQASKNQKIFSIGAATGMVPLCPAGN